MKQLVTIIFFGFSVYSFGQNSNDSLKSNKAFIVKTDLVRPALGYLQKNNDYSASIEIGFRKRHSLQMRGILLTPVINNNIGFTIPNNSFQVIPEYKFFFNTKKGYDGFYIGLYSKYASNIVGSMASDMIGDMFMCYYNQISLGGGGIIGYQNYIGKHFLIDFMVGLGARRLIKTTFINEIVPLEQIGFINGYQNPFAPTSFDGMVSINIGYRF